MSSIMSLKQLSLLNSFYLVSITIISLMFPISLIVLGRLTGVRYLLSLSHGKPASMLFSFLLYTNPNLLCALVSVATVYALSYVIMERAKRPGELPEPVSEPRISSGWYILVALHLLVFVGIMGCTATGVYGPTLDMGGRIVTNVIFFIGILEVTVCWCRKVVKPVVRATLFRGAVEGEEKEVSRERWILGALLGGLYWCKFKLEIEALVAVVVSKREMMVRLELSDVLGWWLYYLTVTVGMARITKGILSIAFARLPSNNVTNQAHSIEYLECHEKV